jgi:flagellar hook-basal body complex protein FliE
MSIKGINFEALHIDSVPGISQPVAPKGVEGTSGGKESFGEMFSKAINEVDQLQKEADGKIGDAMAGRAGVQPHDAMIALEKADLAFQLMNQVRTKIVRAYEDVMRTQV